MRILRSNGTSGQNTNSSPNTESVIDSGCSGSSGSTSLTATNTGFAAGQMIFILQSRGTNVGFGEFNSIQSYSPGTITTVIPLERNYSSTGNSKAQVIVVGQYSGFENSSLLYSKSWDQTSGGLFIRNTNGIFWNKSGATLSLKGRGYLGGNDAPVTTVSQALCGEGTAGPRAYQQGNNGNGGGGGKKTASGGGIDSGGAGAGGHNGAGISGRNLSSAATGGTGGASVGGTDFQTDGIFFGGGGGAGVPAGEGGINTGGIGGNGGGIAIIICDEFRNDGTIDLSGNANTDPNGGGNQDSDGAPGAGGSLWIIARKISNTGTILGVAGTQVGDGTIGPNGAAANGRIQIDTCSGSITTSPTATTNLGGHSFCSSGLLNFLF